MIACQTLGPIAVTVDGRPAPAELLWRKHLAILVYLARSPRGRTREHLVGLLWPDKPEAAARHSLNEAIRVLRRHLGDPNIDTAAGQVRLVREAVQLDVDQLEELVRAGEWRNAAPLIAGDFMEGFSVQGASGFEDWLNSERAAVRQRSIEVLIHCAEELIRSGQVTDAAAVATRALALEPGSEPAIRVAMRSLVLAGDRAGALERYEAFCSRLKEDLGVSPEAATLALAERVRHERAVRPMLSQPMGRAEARPPLVGREAELARLTDEAAAAWRERRATALLIQGESGTGKTRLLEEFLARLRLDGVSLAAVRAVESDRTEERSGILAIARSGLLQAPGITAAPARALSAFVCLLSDWAERFPQLQGFGDPAPLGHALSDVIRAACDEQPVAISVDDAQWLDQASLLTLVGTLRDLAAAPYMLVLSADPQVERAELDELRTRIGRDVRGQALRLKPLDSSDVRALAREMLPRFSEVEIERVVRRVMTDSAGLPLLAVELLRAVALGLDLRGTMGAWPEPLRTLDQTLPGDLPDTVSAAIRIAYRRLSPAAQRALAAASVLGDRVRLETLTPTLGVSRTEAAAALDELEWHRWLLCDSQGYTFVARIVRQVVAREMVTPGQRQRMQATVKHPT